MASDDDRWKSARASADETLSREEALRSQLRASLELAEALIAERRSARTFDFALSPSPARKESNTSETNSAAEENARLAQRVRELSLIVQHVEARAISAEQDLSDLASAYIASSQLHIALEPRAVLTQISELMGQLVGAECFVVYVLQSDGRSARPVAFEGITQTALTPVIVGQGIVGEVLLGGQIYMREESPAAPSSPHDSTPTGGVAVGSLEDPIAVIPMLVAGQAVGVVSVLRLLAQKTAWSAVDHELFRLLSQHAGVALLSAHLYQQKPDFLSALAGLGEGLV